MTASDVVVSPKAKGGHARAAALTPDERKAISKKAAEARWSLPVATHAGVIPGLGDIDCYVLDNGERILSTRGVMRALGRTWRGRKYLGTELPVFLEANNLKPFINSELSSVLSAINFKPEVGGLAEGFKAIALPMVCDVYLSARAAKVLTAPQMRIADQCEMLVRSLAKVGIIALVDEATGYQEVRARDALQAFLEKFIRKELAAWVKTFPDEFFREIYRLKRWKWTGSSRRPGVVGVYIRDLIYERLGPGVLAELERKNPMGERGARKARHHQWLTQDIGNPALAQHMHALIAFMRAEDSWDAFKARFGRAFPKSGESLQMF